MSHVIEVLRWKVKASCATLTAFLKRNIPVRIDISIILRANIKIHVTYAAKTGFSPVNRVYGGTVLFIMLLNHSRIRRNLKYLRLSLYDASLPLERSILTDQLNSKEGMFQWRNTPTVSITILELWIKTFHKNDLWILY